MILANSELKNLASNISALNDYNIQGASIDLSLGDTAKVLIEEKENKVIDLFKIDCDDKLCNEIYKEVDLAKGYELKPKNYLYASSVENVKIPNNMCGIILPRSSFTRIGLILPISSYVNPGYEGHLPIIIYNASNSIIKIPPYIRIMQILFCELKGNSIPYDKQRDSKYHNEKALQTPNFNDIEIKEILAKLKRK